MSFQTEQGLDADAGSGQSSIHGGMVSQLPGSPLCRLAVVMAAADDSLSGLDGVGCWLLMMCRQLSFLGRLGKTSVN